MSAVDLALPRLQTEEGFRALPYKDTNGIETVGFGFNVQAGISKFAAAALLAAQVQEAHGHLLNLAWYAKLDPVRQSVCLDIDINEGEGGLLGFPSMIHYLSLGDWANAQAQCHVADPTLTARYTVLGKILLTGAA